MPGAKKIWSRDTPQKAAAYFMLLLFIYFAVLYSVNHVLTGLTVEGGYYWPWLDEHFDYISGMRTFLLNSASVVVGWFGFENYVDGNILWVKGGRNVRMVYSCIGINVLCVWWAFVLAFPAKLKRKLLMFAGGTILMIALNITRVSVLAMTKKNVVVFGSKIDHHTIYNIIAYGLMFLMIRAAVKKGLQGKAEA